jgi:hypothetical protein
MQYDVVKPFNTVNRRLVPGSSISTDEPIEPFTFEERRENGFIKPPEVEQPSIAVVPPANKLRDAASASEKAVAQ